MPTSQRDAGQRHERRPGRGIEGQRHQAGARLDDAVAELLREPMAEVGRADLRDRQAAGGDHEPRVPTPCRASVSSSKPSPARAHLAHRAGLAPHHAAGVALGQQHGDDVLGRAVAEQLALVLLVPADAVALDQRDEVRRRVARQRRAAEVRVRREEVGRRRVAVREVAAPAAGDADLLRHLGRMVEQQHLRAELPGDRRAVKAGRARADDHRVEVFRAQGWYFQAPFSILTITRARWSRPRWSVGDMLKMPCAPGDVLDLLERVAQRGAERRRARLAPSSARPESAAAISRPASQAWAPKVETDALAVRRLVGLAT